ncbi:conserved hypothetical protein [Candidatus Nitrotoga sp. HW29]|uniref:hypothetical protein n=1 Tax=Candidatus Nitrotoga sp. HW29 TaxID=2886963 RepID=UPI001EF3BD8C|nr:hypothetical protein [Candidatus Nitrotoga sp. HW29]CAH1904092.1 conserved hypothetical protein [Candidatus Nitrotoga sp. HW29]
MSIQALPKFPSSYLLLQQEGFLIRSCLGIGLTELRKADVHNKGAFYTALFNLSIGIERLLKAIVIIDHMLNNSLSVPTKKQLKSYGHNIVELYETCGKIGIKRQCPILSHIYFDATDHSLFLLISGFACTTRYHNLDALSASQSGLDPLVHWGQIIPTILCNDVAKKQKEKILFQADVVANAIDEVTITLMHGLDQSPLTTTEVLALPGLHDQAVRFAVLRIVKLLSPIRDLLGTVCSEAYGLDTHVPRVPQMQEFLNWLSDDRKYVLRKKKWP